MTNVKAMAVGAALGVGLLALLAAVPSQTDFDSTYFRTNALPVTIVGELTNWAKLTTNAAGGTGSAMVGTVSNAVASAGLLAVDATKTNGVVATSAMVQAAAGQVWQATNANLTGWAAIPATSAGVQATLGQVYQGTNTVLTHYAGTDTNTLLAAIGGVAKAGDTMTGTLGFTGSATLLNLPSLTTAQKNAATATAGSQVYDSDLGRVQMFDGAAWHSRVRLDGDSMTGPLLTTGFTNTARTASTFVVAGADKSDVSTATSAMLEATLSDETGSGAAVFGTSPTFQTSITLTNGTSNAGLVLNGNLANSWIFQANIGGTNFGGLTNTGQWIFPDGTVSRPSIAFTSENDGTGTGLYLSAPGQLALTVNGVKIATAKSGVWSCQSALDVGNGNCVLISLAAHSLQLGLDLASPANELLKIGGNPVGTDKNSGYSIIEGTQSTGTGIPGSLIFRTGTQSPTSSSTTNGFNERSRIIAKYVTLLDGVATNLFSITLPTTNSVGLSFICTVMAGNGTELQSLTTPVTVDAIAATVTAKYCFMSCLFLFRPG